MSRNDKSVDRLSKMLGGSNQEDDAFVAFNSNGEKNDDALSDLTQFSTQQVIEEIRYDFIRPDPLQPRRAVPHAVRNSMPDLPDRLFFERWVQEIKLARKSKTDFPIQAILLGEETNDFVSEEDQSIGALESNLLELARLAQDIRAKGLVNPITVVSMPSGGYFIETGERRWLSYCLLNAYLPEENHNKIKAFIQEGFDVWRQAAENNKRENLNAVGKARQVALLLMALISEHTGHEFAYAEDFEHEVYYYAQVADGEQHRIPHGAAERLIAASGLKNKSQLRRHRAILRLDPATWERADDENWSEGKIRNHMEKLRRKEDEPDNSFGEKTNDEKVDFLLETAHRTKLNKRQLKLLRDKLNEILDN
jgi:ParB-like chromosome segregation protein Spo0J